MSENKNASEGLVLVCEDSCWPLMLIGDYLDSVRGRDVTNGIRATLQMRADRVDESKVSRLAGEDSGAISLGD